jgi:hypothetical protein
LFKVPRTQWLLKIKHLPNAGFKHCSGSQNNSKKPGFGRKKSVEDVVTLGPMAQATLVIIKSQVFDVPQAIHPLFV